MKEFRTYRFHTEEGHRLAIFGRELLFSDTSTPRGKLEIVFFKCSPKDAFCKETARAAYAAYLLRGIKGCKALGFKATVDEIEYTTPNYSKTLFNMYCRENFVNPYLHEELTVVVPKKRLGELKKLLTENHF